VPGIHEGRAAGTWTVGVTASGNEVGLSFEEWAALPPADRRLRTDHAGEVLRRAGAQYLVDTVAGLLPVIDEIEQRMAAGERPPHP
jgi:phosphonoacetaldehyde hydrolase